MTSGEYQDLVFKVPHSHMEEIEAGEIGSVARNVRYLNQANGMEGFARAAVLKSGETLQVTPFIDGEKLGPNAGESERINFVRGAEAQFQANGVEVKDLEMPGNIIRDGNGRYWLVDGDNAMAPYNGNALASPGSNDLWKHFLIREAVEESIDENGYIIRYPDEMMEA